MPVRPPSRLNDKAVAAPDLQWHDSAQEANIFKKWYDASDDFPIFGSREKKIEIVELQANEGRSTILAVCRPMEGRAGLPPDSVRVGQGLSTSGPRPARLEQEEVSRVGSGRVERHRQGQGQPGG